MGVARSGRFAILWMFLVLVLASGRALAQAAVPASEQQLREAQAEVDRLKQELAAMRALYDARLSALEERLGALAGGAPSAPAPPLSPAPAPAPEPPSEPVPATLPEPPPAPPVAAQQNVSVLSKVFNPDIAVIGSFVGAAGHNANSDQPALGLQEVETSFRAVVDPYARADFYLSAGPEGLEIEEGFVTFNSLPGGLLLKAGKMRAQFGKVNTLHTHALPSTDRPLVTENLVGGDEGISESGLSVSRLIPNAFMFLEATGETYYGNSDVFQSTERSNLAYVGRIRAYRDLTEGTNLDLGGSVAYGPSAAPLELPLLESPLPELPLLDPDVSTRLLGFDATFRYRPLRRALYRRFQARTELIWSRPSGAGVTDASAFGFYGSADYQFARRWYVGGRVDRSAHAFDASLVDKGGSLYMTYWPSEFSQIRGQYRRTAYGDGVKANEFLFQFVFAIGAHGAHTF